MSVPLGSLLPGGSHAAESRDHIPTPQRSSSSPRRPAQPNSTSTRGIRADASSSRNLLREHKSPEEVLRMPSPGAPLLLPITALLQPGAVGSPADEDFYLDCNKAAAPFCSRAPPPSPPAACSCRSRSGGMGEPLEPRPSSPLEHSRARCFPLGLTWLSLEH